MSLTIEHARPKSSPAAEIDIYGGVSVVKCLAGDIADLLIIRQTSFVSNGPLGLARKDTRSAWFQVQRDGRLRIPTGCVPRVCDRLTAMGMTVTVRDHRRYDDER